MRALVLAGVLTLVSCGAVGAEDDEEEKQQAPEAPVTLPAAPRPENLVEMYVGANATSRFFVDAASLNVLPEGILRYTAVIVSPSGARTVNYEGMRCSGREIKLYAFGRADGGWSNARKPDWRPINTSGPGRYQYILARDFFCPNAVPVRDAAEALRALERGASAEHTN